MDHHPLSRSAQGINDHDTYVSTKDDKSSELERASESHRSTCFVSKSARQSRQRANVAITVFLLTAAYSSVQITLVHWAHNAISVLGFALQLHSRPTQQEQLQRCQMS